MESSSGEELLPGDPEAAAALRRRSTQTLTEAFESWRALRPWVHLAAVGGFALAALLWWWSSTTYGYPLPDERSYTIAFERVAAGGSPYATGGGGGYFYPPAFAFAGAWLLEHSGPLGPLVVIRGANLLGLGSLLWIALAWVPLRGWLRWLVGLATMLVSPAIWMGVAWGNLSLAVAGVVLVGLLVWPRWPVAAGVLLGTSVAVKPIAVLAIGLLLVHRAPRGRQHQLAAAVGLSVAAVLLVAFPYRSEMLALGSLGLERRSASLHRIAYLFVGPGATVVVSFLVALVGTWAVRARVLGRLQMLVVVVSATLTATPLVWGHTFLVTMPLQSAAAAVLWSRSPHHQPFERTLVALAIAICHLGQGVTGIDDQGLLLQLAGTLTVVLGPLFLAWYVVASTEVV